MQKWMQKLNCNTLFTRCFCGFLSGSLRFWLHKWQKALIRPIKNVNQAFSMVSNCYASSKTSEKDIDKKCTQFVS
jgi:hypothetical protein